jgi:hypothetical protein
MRGPAVRAVEICGEGAREDGFKRNGLYGCGDWLGPAVNWKRRERAAVLGKL